MPNRFGLPLGTPSTLGRHQQQADVPIVDTGDGHLITFAPTGAGKGVSCVIPALLSWAGPCIVIDPKGEAFAVTAARRRALGQRVHVLDPFDVTRASEKASLNPMDLITPDSASAGDDAAVIAQLLAQDLFGPEDAFWEERGRTLITGLILYALIAPRPLRNLAEVRHHLESGLHEQMVTATDMMRTPNLEMRAAAAILNMPGMHRTRTSIMSTACSHVSFIRSGPVQASLATSTIDLAAVQRGDPVTIYLVLPPDKLVSHGKLLRLWLGTLMTMLTRRRECPPVPTLLLIDEAAQLGPLQEFRTAVTLMRGYGVRCWSFWQDLAQLRQIYPRDWQSLVNNCAVQQYFGLSTPQAAAEISDYLDGASPKPIGHLADDEALLIRRGERPAIVVRPNYLEDKAFVGQFANNPFFRRHASGTWAEALPPVPGRTNVLAFPQSPRSSQGKIE
jgi:type IV secretion system protein VirD4